jgi:predicted alpha-1,2-mannosidase
MSCTIVFRLPIIAAITAIVLTACAATSGLAAEDPAPSSFVNPFIGTARGGNTFPGAVCPWGMVSASPHTDLAAPSGYIHGRPWFYGLGHVHLSGTGCADLGSILVTAVRGDVRCTPDGYRTPLGKEIAKPGYYSTELPALRLTVDATATARGAITRFRSTVDGVITILIDVGRSLALVGGGEASFTSPTVVEGYNCGGGFCGESNRHFVYFSAAISTPTTTRGTWSDTTVGDRTSVTTPEGVPAGAWAAVALRQGEMVELRVGISYVSVENARQNRETELGAKSFETVRQEVERSWDNVLNTVHTHGGTHAAHVQFYTALYHSLIHPNVITDVNGEFPLMGHRGTGRYDNRDRYTVFSLWDTYRTLHPLLTLLYPDRQSAIVRTMLDMYTESGHLPKWELAGNETFMMVGDPAVPVVADAYINHLGGVDTSFILPALTAGCVPGADSLRPGYDDMCTLGFIPMDQDTTAKWWVWGPVSSMLEYGLADWTIAQVAGRMGKQPDAEEFLRRSRLYRNLFDRTTGFLRPRLRTRQLFTPFDPLATEGSGNWGGSGGPGYVEGNAWNYTWSIPHDVPGLAALFGGTDRCAAKLDSCFQLGQFTINNEPDIAYPYLFTYYPGWEHRTRELVETIARDNFGTGPDGLPGNDDAGAISAWYVFSAMGLYPACPASGEYRLGIPLFEEIELQVTGKDGSTQKLAIHNNCHTGSSSAPVQVRWNGKLLGSFVIPHAELIKGGTLQFTD